jgi:hypothetical protein
MSGTGPTTTPRLASTPLEQGGRDAIRTACAGIIAFVARSYVPEEIRNEVTLLVLVGLSTGGTMLGAWLRDRAHAAGTTTVVGSKLL